MAIWFSISITYSQSTQNIYSPQVHFNLETLEGDGLIPQGSLAQRPLSEEMILKLLDEAEQRIDENHPNYSLIVGIREILKNDALNQGKNFRVDVLNKVSISQVITNQKETLIEGNGLSGVNAIFQPLLSNKQGRMYRGYYNAYLETNHSLSYRKRFAVQMQPQLTLNPNNTVSNQLRFQKLLFKANLGIAELSIGRENLVWGLRSNGGLLFSNNAPPLDMIKISTTGQKKLPWFLKGLGTFNLSSFVADLGKNYSRPNAKMAAYRIDYQPTEKWDFGIEHTVTLGGVDNNNSSAYRIIGEFTGFLIRPGDPSPSNHNIALSVLRKFQNFSTYVTAMFEDTDSNLEMLFVHDATWLFGFYKPGLGNGNLWNLRSELIRSGPRAYRHGIYSDGHAINQKILGFALGPDVWYWNTTLSYNKSRHSFLSMNFNYLNRSGNSYRVIVEGNGDFVDLDVTDTRPNEKHHILGLNWVKPLSNDINVNIDFGLDYTHNQGFTNNSSRLDYMLGFVIEFYPKL